MLIVCFQLFFVSISHSSDTVPRIYLVYSKQRLLAPQTLLTHNLKLLCVLLSGHKISPKFFSVIQSLCFIFSFQDESKPWILSLLFFITARDGEKESGDKDGELLLSRFEVCFEVLGVL